MKSLRTRLVVVTTVVVVFTGFAISWFAWKVAEAAQRRDVDQILRDKATILGKSLNRQNPREVYPISGEMQRDELQYFGQGFDTNRVLLWKSSSLPEEVPLAQPTAWLARQHLSHHFETQVHADLGPLRVVTYPIWEVQHGQSVVYGFVQILKPLEGLQDSQIGLAGRFLAATLLAALLAALATHLLVSRWLSAMAQLADSTRQFGDGFRHHGRLPVPQGDPEAAAVSRAFNDMLSRLDRAIANERRFLADASHELRTPLTILRGEIDVVLRRDRTAAEYRTILLSNREEIERLSRLTEALLLLARTDAGLGLGGRTTLDLAAVAGGVQLRMEPMAHLRGVTLQAAPAPSNARVLGDPLALERVIFNLVENAVRHSPAGESVEIRVGRDTHAWLQVVDCGCGIAPEHLPRLFERFYRVDSARNRAGGGVGLGMAIVQSLVEAHEGTVTVNSELGQGTVVTVRLPLKEG